jgi:16S rRNA (uracil1498-N3)-methyltransferase
MHRFFVCRDSIKDGYISITGDDSEHISKVLRLRPGDEITICDGMGTDYLCSIHHLDRKSVICHIIKGSPVNTESPLIVHLYQGIPKSTKMDLIIQKCTELGIDKIVPVYTERVVVRREDIRDSSNKTARWQRIAEEASKQSRRGHIPSIENPLSYAEIMERFDSYDMVVIPYEKENSRGLKQVLKGKNNINRIAMVIGPEGGFTENEIIESIENGAVPVTLGPRILRTETAGFACLSMLMYECGEIGGESWER